MKFFLQNSELLTTTPLTQNTVLGLLIATVVLLSLFFISVLIIFFTNRKIRLFLKSTFQTFSKKRKINYMEINNFAKQLAGVLLRLSNDVVGGLIVVERKDNLDDYVKLGYSVTANFSSEFVVNIFYNKSSPLHDGGMIIRNTKIISVSSYFPMTKKNLVTLYGARHRAAVGVTEETDAIAFVVSETTGKICYAYKGKIYYLSQSIEKLPLQVYDLVTKGYISEQSEVVTINDSIEEK